ncbi:uncharacterized protein DUF4238 [Tamilnaduibacter salinus]|uniref:Uncharacterized protein DUF4238 n=1 Tax=Tamilnaduibacter salinus TaxID=1484056 RepID=A0A2U1CXU3_9GAMM|nr:DUF4238 domain-containing protein [Tamilnaduibacter salinus]PVY77318.1 uncharacterized protein DUF4238 [Tamilnaduibacter salinus]
MNKPVNHHFVPQHFLSAWAIGRNSKKLCRYRRISHTGKLETKEASIKHSANAKNLYEIVLPDGAFEIESTHVTPKLDEVGYKALNSARSLHYSKIPEKTKKDLAFYLTCLEARNPAILDLMAPTDEEFQIIKNSMNNGSSKSVNEVFSYIGESPSKGVMAFALFVINEITSFQSEPFHHGLLNANVEEFDFDADCLITSDYPTFRMGHYNRDVLFAVAVNPRKALVYSKNEFAKVFKMLPKNEQIKMINLLTIAKASAAYAHNDSFSPFVEDHLGWALADSSQEYIQQYILKALSQ